MRDLVSDPASLVEITTDRHPSSATKLVALLAQAEIFIGTEPPHVLLQSRLGVEHSEAPGVRIRAGGG